MKVDKVRAVVIGCGYVADLYMVDLLKAKYINIVGCHDISLERLEKFSSFYDVKAYSSLNELIKCPAEVWIVLTNPSAHLSLCRIGLDNNKNIFCEKPLGGDISEIDGLLKVAQEKKLCLQAAPSNIYSATSVSLKNILNENKIGKEKLAFINYEAGMTHLLGYKRWVSVTGAQWPAKEEFELGCLQEHGGYILTLACWLWGEIESVSVISDLIFPDKGLGQGQLAADLNILYLKFKSGMKVKASVGMVATPDRTLTIYGEEGSLHIRDIRDDEAAVFHSPYPGSRLSKAIHVRIFALTNTVSRIFGFLPFNWNIKAELYRSIGKRSKLSKIFGNKTKNSSFSLGIEKICNDIKTNTQDYTSIKISRHIQEILNEIDQNKTKIIPNRTSLK